MWLALFLTALVSVPSRAAAPLGATVLGTEGLTSLEPQHTSLQVGKKLGEGDRVTVMAASKLRLRLAGGAVVELGPHSELVLKRAAAGDPYLRLNHGDLLLVSPGEKEVEVRVSQIKFHITAKAFFLRQPLDQPAYVCVCEGKATAKWPVGEIQLAGKDHERAVRIYPDRAKPVAANDDTTEHDAEIVLLRHWLDQLAL